MFIEPLQGLPVLPVQAHEKVNLLFTYTSSVTGKTFGSAVIMASTLMVFVPARVVFA
jgi:hypothetical protein